MASEVVFSYRDYSKEPSNAKFRVQDMTAANFDATITLINSLSTAILGVQVENTLQTKRVVAQNNFISRAPATDKSCQREIKWLVSLEDTTLHSVSRHEIPQADPTLVSANSDFVDLSAGAGAALKTAIEAVVKSPAGNSVVVLAVELVGKRI